MRIDGSFSRPLQDVHMRPVLLPPCIATPTDIPTGTHWIRFHHPGYKKQTSLLFSLPGFDTVNGGLHHETALIACAIVACNRFDGYLSTSPGGSRIDVDAQGCLMRDDYYFIVPSRHTRVSPSTIPSIPSLPAGESGSAPTPLTPYTGLPPITASLSLSASAQEDTEPYPIVPSFQEWEFPLGELPGLWAAPIQDIPKAAIRSTSDAVLVRDVTCRMTAYVEECDVAHLCPEKESEWFKRNGMGRYASCQRSQSLTINEPANLLLLRADVRRAFDKRHLVFLPKVKGLWSTHVLGESQHHRVMYHNRKLHPTAIASQYVFTRFAWAIFPLLGGFLDCGSPRRLKLTGNDEPTWESALNCSNFVGSRLRPRNASPEKRGSQSKRKRDDEGVPETEELGPETNGDKGKEVLEDRAEKRRRVSTTTDGDAANGDTSSSPDRRRRASSVSAGTAIGSDQDCTLIDVSRLKDELLEKERARSDPEGSWEVEQQWLESIFQGGGALDSKDYRRFYEALGQEVISD